MSIADKILNGEEHGDVSEPKPSPNKKEGETTTTDEPEKKDPPETVETEKEITDEILLKELSKKMGREIKSLDELNNPPAQETEEQKKAREKAKKDAAIQFGIERKKFDLDTYNAFVRDSEREDSELAFDVFKAQFLENIAGTDKEGTFEDDDIRSLFEQQYLLGEQDDTNPLKKIKANEIKRIAADYRKGKYDAILSVEDSYESEQAELQKATKYKGIVEQAISQLPAKLTFDIEGVAVDVEPTEEELNAVKALYLDAKAYQSFGAEITEPSQLRDAIMLNLQQRSVGRIVVSAAKAYYTTKIETEKLGRRGAAPHREGGAAETGQGTKGHADAILDNADSD